MVEIKVDPNDEFLDDIDALYVDDLDELLDDLAELKRYGLHMNGHPSNEDFLENEEEFDYDRWR